ncbi:Peptidase M48, Ste24p precursor [Dissulfuribacter thermophilus]|uniref:Protease HtpX homolog n=1 Tax=Dissulfuribacter thermophilus TaxID=1156395 RepID=A0A1B9F9I8_9BACT|nr:zinc metalloprotease HtpX [Dissulfuribacter thermophilus]OCC16451.1 Peptidase M48, Ste24p precursor [Dissulfuribacter thermophilus]
MVNVFKTFLLLAALTALFMFIGEALGGRTGMIMALMLAMVMNFFAYWFSDKMALAMSGATPVSEAEAPELHQMVEILSQKAGIPKPKVYIIPQETPNAFATGRNPNHAAVAVTAGIMRILSKEELMGVLSHELAHIKNRDILISSIAAVLAGAISYLANMAQWGLMFGGLGGSDDEDGNPLGIIGVIIMMILAPIAAMLIQMAISRSREYLADATGARILGDPVPLASALKRLEEWNHRLPMAVNPATAQMYIVNPLRSGNIMHLFSTHPPIEERIKKLLSMK